MHFLKTVVSLRRFKEKTSVASSGKKFVYFIGTLIQLAFACGFGVLAYYLFTLEGGSLLATFGIVFAVVSALCAILLAIVGIIKIFILLSSGGRNNRY